MHSLLPNLARGLMHLAEPAIHYLSLLNRVLRGSWLSLNNGRLRSRTLVPPARRQRSHSVNHSHALECYQRQCVGQGYSQRDPGKLAITGLLLYHLSHSCPKTCLRDTRTYRESMRPPHGRALAPSNPTQYLHVSANQC